MQAISNISACYDPVRAIVGDFGQFRTFDDSALASVLRTVLMLGEVTGHELAADNQAITPAITSPKALAQLVYKSAKKLFGPNSGSYSYRTRALSESFGDRRQYFRELENALENVENGEMFSSFQSFHDWMHATTGVNIWAVMMDMKVRAPVGTVSVGRDGIQVNE